MALYFFSRGNLSKEIGSHRYFLKTIFLFYLSVYLPASCLGQGEGVSVSPQVSSFEIPTPFTGNKGSFEVFDSLQDSVEKEKKPGNEKEEETKKEVVSKVSGENLDQIFQSESARQNLNRAVVIKGAGTSNAKEVAASSLRVKAPSGYQRLDPIPAKELDFLVCNKTDRDLYITCFTYIKKRVVDSWRWDKSPVYFLKPNETVLIDIDTIADKVDRKHVFGYLSVFATKKEAEEAMYELLDDRNKIDLDRLYFLKEKTVDIVVEQYGFKRFIDYRVEETKNKKQEELDVWVTNNSGGPLWVTLFVYQKDPSKEYNSEWAFRKTDAYLMAQGEEKQIDVGTFYELYDWIYVRGFLGVFKADQEERAKTATFELLQPQEKIDLGRLADLRGKRVVLEVESYGVKGVFIDLTIQPIRRIPFGSQPMGEFRKKLKKERQKGNKNKRRR